MFAKLLSTLVLMAICVLIHAMGLVAFLRWSQTHHSAERRSFWRATSFLVRIAACTILLHLVEISVWALQYTYGGALPDLGSALYFSAVTYTTTGYGDLVLPPDWRLAGAVEALTGILMCGLSTGMYFAIFSRLFHLSRIASRPTDPSHHG